MARHRLDLRRPRQFIHEPVFDGSTPIFVLLVIAVALLLAGG